MRVGVDLIEIERVRRALDRHGDGFRERCFTAECTCGFARDYARSFPSDQVRLTSIYSRQDGVVRWQGAVDRMSTLRGRLVAGHVRRE